MNKLKNVLAALLVVQLAAVLGLYWQGRQQQQSLQTQDLLAFARDDLTRIAISDGSHSVTLSKVDGHWLLPDEQQLPVDGAQLDALLSKLQAVHSGWPVATTPAAQARFEVADDKFQRRIELYAGEQKTGELLVGSSPGFRKVHVRRPGDNAIYSVTLNSYELPASGKDWLDKALLSASGLTTISGGDYALAKQGEQWTLARGEGTTLDPAKAEQLAAAFKSLRVMGIAEAKPAADAIRVAVNGPDGQWDYAFAKAGETYLVQRSDRDRAFTISQFDYDRIAQVALPQLAMAAPQPAAGEDAAGAEADAAETGAAAPVEEEAPRAAAELAPQPDQSSAHDSGQQSRS